MSCRPDLHELGIGVPRFVGRWAVERSSYERGPGPWEICHTAQTVASWPARRYSCLSGVELPAAEYVHGSALLAVALVVRNPAADAYVVVASLRELNVAAPLVIAPSAEGTCYALLTPRH